MMKSRRRDKQVKHQQRATRDCLYELSFVTGPSLLERLFGRPSYEAQDDVHAVADVIRRITSGSGPMLCMTCDHAFEHDLPTVIIIAKPFASRRGPMIASPICAACAAQGREAVIAGALERFRANGMADARKIEAGSA